MREGGQINIAVFFYFGSFDPLFLGERGRKNMAGSKKVYTSWSIDRVRLSIAKTPLYGAV